MNVTKSDDENACVLASLTVSARSMERCAPFLPGIGPARGRRLSGSFASCLHGRA